MAEAAVAVFVEAPGMAASARVAWEHGPVAAYGADTAHTVAADEVEADTLAYLAEVFAAKVPVAAVVVEEEEGEEAVSLL